MGRGRTRFSETAALHTGHSPREKCNHLFERDAGESFVRTGVGLGSARVQDAGVRCGTRMGKNIAEVRGRIRTCICRTSSRGARTASRRVPEPAPDKCCTRSTSSRGRRSPPFPPPWRHRPVERTAPGPARTRRSRKPPARRPGGPRATASAPACLSLPT